MANFPHHPLVVAHRGASAVEPENTITAFEAAVRIGADFVELDVRLTADGVPIILHDADLSRSTDGAGLVHGLTLAEVKRFDASGGRGPREEVPTLQEALAAVASNDSVGVNLEIKNLPGEESFDSPREAILEESLRTLEDASFSGPVVVSSFNWLTIERCRVLAPSIRTGFLTIAAIDPLAALVYARGAGHDLVLPQLPALLGAGQSFVDRAHDEGVGVGTWTADDEDVLETLFSWGVDAVASNRPDLAVAVRDRVLARSQ